MIKCLCKENVQDRLTGENYIAGEEYYFSKERAEEVTNTKYFEMVKEIDSPYEEDLQINNDIKVETKPKKIVKKSTK